MKKSSSVLSHFGRGLKRLVYPPYCLFCQDPLILDAYKAICPPCLDGIARINPHDRCHRCFQSNCLFGTVCRVKLNYCRRLLATFEYGGVPESIMEAFKVGGRSYLSEGMAALMTLSWLEADYPLPDLIVPVPSSPVTSFKRGFEPSLMLAQTIATLMNRPLWRGLKKEVSFLKQAHLTKEERFQNKMAPLYLVKDPKELEDKAILLIDDVMTTGYTIQQAAKLLFEGYPRSVDGLLFAVAD